MKKFAKLLVLALAVAVMTSAFALVASAEETANIDPNTLQPGSEDVYFIKDAPRDENNVVVGELEGDGTGLTPDNPLIPSEDHEKWNGKRWHVLTSLYQAIELLSERGGTIVLTGPVRIGINEVGDNGSPAVRDNESVSFGNNVIKITSVYNGVDYRKEAGAKLILDDIAMLLLNGSTIWENIDIATGSTGRIIHFCNYPTLIGEGVKCYPTDEAFEGVPQNYVSLSGGKRWDGLKDKSSNMVIKSGTYYNIYAASSGDSTAFALENYNSNLTIDGTTTVLGTITGTVGHSNPFSGNVNITINNGTFECDINGVGPTGFVNTDGIVNIKINGGDFKNAWSINQVATGAKNNLPAACTVDFSGWTGDVLGLAYANVAITDITDIKLPEGVTAAQLQEAIDNAPIDDPIDEPADTTDANEPDATEPEATKPAATVAPDVEETKAPVVIDDDGEEGGNNTTLIIIIVVAVVVIAGVVVGIVLAKKKKK